MNRILKHASMKRWICAILIILACAATAWAVDGVARLNFSHAAASDMAGAGEPLAIGVEVKYKAKVIGFGGY